MLKCGNLFHLIELKIEEKQGKLETGELFLDDLLFVYGNLGCFYINLYCSVCLYGKNEYSYVFGFSFLSLANILRGTETR